MNSFNPDNCIERGHYKAFNTLKVDYKDLM